MEEKRDLTLEFIRYSHSEQDLAQYCKENNLDYLEFVDVVNKWNEHYGIPLVEKCMHRLECTDVDGELNGSYESVIEEIPYDESHDLIIRMTPKQK